MAEQSSNKWSWIWAAVALVAIAVAGYLFLNPRTKTINSTTTKTVFQKVPEIQTVTQIQRVYVRCPEKGVVALDKAAVAEKLDMPWLNSGDLAQAAANKVDGVDQVDGVDKVDKVDHTAMAQPATPTPQRVLEVEGGGVIPAPAETVEVTATGSLAESPNGYDVVNLFNTGTGISELVAKEKASPWMEFRNKYGLGVRYGVGIGNGQTLHTGTFYGFWEFMRIKDVYATGYGEVTSDAVGKAQIDMQWRPR